MTGLRSIMDNKGIKARRVSEKYRVGDIISIIIHVNTKIRVIKKWLVEVRKCRYQDQDPRSKKRRLAKTTRFHQLLPEESNLR